MNIMKVNAAHVHGVCEKIEVLRYLRFVAERLIFSLLIPFSHDLSKLGRNLVYIIFI